MAALEKFAETAARHWNFEGQPLTAAFDASRARWAYTDTTFEPRLFDRAQAWHLLAEMTGSARWPAQAASDLSHYESHLSAAGFFLNKAGEDDTKYSYVHPRSPNPAKQAAAYAATVAGFPDRADLRPNALWTERELWVVLSAALGYRVVSGGAAPQARAQAMFGCDDMLAGRLSAGDAFSALCPLASKHAALRAGLGCHPSSYPSIQGH